jgi:hypothetical protein
MPLPDLGDIPNFFVKRVCAQTNDVAHSAREYEPFGRGSWACL